MVRGLVSIVVPVYNTVEYVEECIKSVLNQTYTNWELILVNDGSTDGSEIICEQYTAGDDRIKLIHQKNGGQSKARNEALTLCSGEFYVFLDSDDRLTNEALTVLQKAIIDDEADISCGVITKFSKNRKKCIYKTNKNYVLDSIEACKSMFVQNGLDSNTVAKMYRAHLWENIRFPEGTIFEDVPIMYKIILRSDKVAFCQECVYEQRSRDGSTTRMEYSDKRKVYVDYAINVYKDVKKMLPELEKEAYVYYLTAVIDNYISISCSRNLKRYKLYRHELYCIIQKNKKVIKEYACLSRMLIRINICRLGVGRLSYRLYQKVK